MAITPTNSNSVNISNLPKAQLAIDTDLLILQTNNGTQAIAFGDLNVVKTDINGNAITSNNGNLSANNTVFGTINVSSITAANIETAIGRGTSVPTDYYSRFTIQNGIILSAIRTIDSYQNDPMYLQVQNDIDNAVNPITRNIQYKIIDNNSTTTVVAGTSANTITIGDFFYTYNTIIPSNITPAHFTLRSSTPYYTSAFPTNIVPVLSSAFAALSSLATLDPRLSALSSSAAITNVYSGIPPLTAISLNVPVIPYIVADSIQQPVNTNDLQFTISTGQVLNTDVLIYYRLFLTSPI